MKMRFAFTAFALIVVFFCAAPVHAQATNPQHTASVPFAFQVGDLQMPAGNYTFTQFENRIQIRALDIHKTAIVTTIPFVTRQYANTSRLHFERKGEAMILSTVYFAGRDGGIELLNKQVRPASRM